jgi:hypothetical protein
MPFRGKCPHCLDGVQFTSPEIGCAHNWYRGDTIRAKTEAENYEFGVLECPTCNRAIIKLVVSKMSAPNSPVLIQTYPLGSQRPPVPQEVPTQITKMYNEAALVLPFSEEASAALSRRCLQSVLVDAGKAKKKDLADQITEILPSLPSYLQTQVDAIRNTGNFASHPIKSQSSGQIVEVEQGEAEWNLDVLDMLFDFYYAQPAKIKQKRQALDQKLKDLGKPPMK